MSKSVLIKTPKAIDEAAFIERLGEVFVEKDIYNLILQFEGKYLWWFFDIPDGDREEAFTDSLVQFSSAFSYHEVLRFYDFLDSAIPYEAWENSGVPLPYERVLSGARIFTHDELVGLLFEEYAKADEQKYTDLFLVSLSTGHMLWRSGLAALKKIRDIPEHTFMPIDAADPQSACAVCRCRRTHIRDYNGFIPYYFEEGALYSGGLLELYYFLSATNKLFTHQPRKADREIFAALSEAIATAPTREAVLQAMQHIKGFEADEQECIQLLNSFE